jgi:hypothetical protein
VRVWDIGVIESVERLVRKQCFAYTGVRGYECARVVPMSVFGIRSYGA